MARQTLALPSIVGLLAAGTVAILLPAAAHATERFPRDVAAALPGIPVPDCSLCHSGGTTGRGTATTPFCLALRARGLTVGDASSVARSIEKMVSDHVDSDGDGTTDIDELTMGSDPNIPAGANAPQPIQYGCAQIAPGNAARSGAAGLLVVALALPFALRRRSRRRRSTLSSR